MTNTRGLFTLLAAQLALWPRILATSTSPGDLPTPTTSQETSMVTLPVYRDCYSAYVISLITPDDKTIALGLDLTQPDIWIIDANEVLDCSALFSLYDTDLSTVSDPVSATYNGTTYNARQCYYEGAITPIDVSTVTEGTMIRTVTEPLLVPTSSPYNITYYDGLYAAGQFVNADFFVDGKIGKVEGPIQIPNLRYLLVNDTPDFHGAFGVGGNPKPSGFMDNFQIRGLVRGNGYSLFLYRNDTCGGLSGYLLPGSVDLTLYTGDFYVFEPTPHEGNGDKDTFLPILQLDAVTLKNLETNELAVLYDSAPIPVVLDTSFSYSYLPREVIVSLALQTDAYYNALYDTWIVNCTGVSDINAAVEFRFGPLSVPVPLSLILELSNNYNLTFADGLDLCLFSILPSESMGYPVLGSKFLQHIYFAMDNDSGLIAVANANKTRISDEIGPTCNSSAVDYIKSGHIPFATPYLAPNLATLTFSSFNASALYSDPRELTNVFISSDHVYISLAPTFKPPLGTASAADPKTTSGASGSLRVDLKTNCGYGLYLILLSGGLMVVALL